MPKESSESVEPEMPMPGNVPTKRRSWLRKLFLVAFLVFFVPFPISRWIAVSYRIQTVEIPIAESKVGDTPASNRVPSDGQFRVVSYNIAHGRGQAPSNWTEGGAAKSRRVDAIGEQLRQLDVDVVVLNEVDFSSTWSGHVNQARQIAKVAGFRYCVEQPNLNFRFAYGSWSFGNAILSKHPIANAQFIELPPEKSWESWLVGSKNALVATIKLSPTQLVRVAAVHLEHRSESTRVDSAEVLLDLIDPSAAIPLVVAGDFNSTPSDFPKSNQTTDGKNALDILLDNENWQYSPQQIPSAQEMTFSTMDPTSVIDWILVSSNQYQLHRYRVIDSELSDHFPIEATLQPRSSDR